MAVDRLVHRSFLLVVVAAALASPAVIEAQAMGRLQLTIKDSTGEPLQGVEVTATSVEIPGFNQKKISNKKGRVLLAFADATRQYQLLIEKEGYVSAEPTIDPQVGSTQIEEVVLVEVGAAAGGSGDVASSMAVYTKAETLFNEGVKQLHSGDLEGAESKILQALEADENLAAAHGALASIYLERNETEAAIESAHRLSELEPENPHAYRLLYEGHKAAGDKAAADDALARMGELSAGGDTVALVYNEGIEAARMGDSKGARARFEQALEIDPDLVPALSALAVLNMRQEQWQPAVGLADRILLLDPDNTKAQQIRFDAYKMLGDEEMAAQAWQQLSSSDPAATATRAFAEGVDQFNSGSMDQAIDSFERALSLDESLVRAHYYLGLAYTNQQRSDRAREHLEQFVAGAPDDPDADLAREMLQHLTD